VPDGPRIRDFEVTPLNGSGGRPGAHQASCRLSAPQVHMTSLLHGLAMQHLRGDWELANLVPHDYASAPPPNVGALLSACLAARSKRPAASTQRVLPQHADGSYIQSWPKPASMMMQQQLPADMWASAPCAT
jgi:hypothetical protein